MRTGLKFYHHTGDRDLRCYWFGPAAVVTELDLKLRVKLCRGEWPLGGFAVRVKDRQGMWNEAPVAFPVYLNRDHADDVLEAAIAYASSIK